MILAAKPWTNHAFELWKDSLVTTNSFVEARKECSNFFLVCEELWNHSSKQKYIIELVVRVSLLVYKVVKSFKTNNSVVENLVNVRIVAVISDLFWDPENLEASFCITFKVRER